MKNPCLLSAAVLGFAALLSTAHADPAPPVDTTPKYFKLAPGHVTYGDVIKVGDGKHIVLPSAAAKLALLRGGILGVAAGDDNKELLIKGLSEGVEVVFLQTADGDNVEIIYGVGKNDADLAKLRDRLNQVSGNFNNPPTAAAAK